MSDTPDEQPDGPANASAVPAATSVVPASASVRASNATTPDVHAEFWRRRRTRAEMMKMEEGAGVKHAGRIARTDVMLEGSTPFVDSNPDLFDPFSLIGSDAYSLGLYYQIRMADIVVSPAMDYLRSRVESFPVEFVEPPNPTAAELACLAFVREFAKECVVGGVSSVIAHIYDDQESYGAAIRERVIEDYKGHRYGMRLRLFPVSNWSIQRYLTAPGDEARLLGVTQNRGAHIPADKLLYTGRKPAPGAWVGMSRLRPFMAVKEVVEGLLQSLMERAQNDKGVPVVRESVAEAAATGNVQTVLEFCADYMEGVATPIYLPFGYEVEMFAPSASVFSNVQDLLQYFDTLRRSALMQSLENVGVTSGGNRALGGEFRLADNQRFAAALSSFARALNGDSEDAGDLGDIPGYIARLGGYYGCRPPRLTFDGLGRVDVRDSLGEIREMIAGGVDLQLDDQDIESIRPALGLRDRSEEADEDDTATEAQPLSGIQVSTAAEVIVQALSGQLPRESAVALLMKLGFSREEAGDALPEGVSVAPESETPNETDTPPAQASACGCVVIEASADTPSRPSLNNRQGAGPFEREIDWDKLEGKVERAIGGTVREIEAVGREQREEFARLASAAISAGDIVAASDIGVDFTEEYAAVLRESLRTRARAIGEEQAAEEMRTLYRGMEPERQDPEDGTPSLEEEIEAAALRGARTLDDEANEGLRAAALAVIGGVGIARLTRWTYPPTIATGVASASTMSVANKAHTRRLLLEGPRLEYAQVLEVMDRNTCEPCAEHNERIFEVGSQAYHDHMPPYARCASNLSVLGNRCRGWMVYLTRQMRAEARNGD